MKILHRQITKLRLKIHEGRRISYQDDKGRIKTIRKGDKFSEQAKAQLERCMLAEQNKIEARTLQCPSLNQLFRNET